MSDGVWNLPVWVAQRQGLFEANGVATVLMLRSRFATPPKSPTDPAKYVDRTDLERALS